MQGELTPRSGAVEAQREKNMTLQIFLLGQFNLRVNDQPLKLPSRPAQSLLAYLVIHAGMKQRREKLAGLLWPEATETNARSYLRQALWRIRKALEGSSLDSDRFLDVDDISVTFSDDAAYWLDVAGFLSPGSTPALDALLSAVALYKGELLPGFYDSWVALERERLAVVYSRRMTALLERLAAESRWEEVMHWAERWIALGDVPEPAYRALMRAHAARGDAGAAMAAYQRCREALRQELAVEPSAETRQLADALRLAPGPVPGRLLSPPAGDLAALAEFERHRADLYQHAARRSNRLALGALLGLAAAVGVAAASWRRRK